MGQQAPSWINSLNTAEQRAEIELYISEYDIESTDDQTQLQYMHFPIFYEHPQVVGITLWGYI